MPVFAYKVKDPEGHDAEGWLEAENQEALIEFLHQQGKIILSIEPRAVSRRRGQGGLALRLVEPSVKSQELVHFTTQLSAMVDAGLPLLRSINVLTQETGNIRLRRILEDVSLKIEAGSSFSQALAQHPTFSNLFVSLVRAGELSGRLHETLKQLAQYMEKAEAIRKTVRNVLVYPMIVMGFSVMVVSFFLLVLIPIFARHYSKFGAKLPRLTLFFMDVSQGLRENLLVIVPLVLLVGGGLWIFLRTEAGRYLKDFLVIRVPVVGPLVLKSALARLSRTLGVLVGSGIPFLEALELVTLATDHRVMRRGLTRAAAAIQGGSTIAAALEDRALFPSMLVSMIASGEEVGALDQMLIKAADYYDQQVGSSVAVLMTVLEPFLILFLGGMIAVILLAMYLPVLTLGRAIR